MIYMYIYIYILALYSDFKDIVFCSLHPLKGLWGGGEYQNLLYEKHRSFVTITYIASFFFKQGPYVTSIICSIGIHVLLFHSLKKSQFVKFITTLNFLVL